MNVPRSVESYLQELCSQGPQAIAILGSYAREVQRPFSDVDVLCLAGSDQVVADQEPRNCGGVYVTVSFADACVVEDWFTQPAAAVSVIQGLRDGQAYWDPQQQFAAIQRRARAFVWGPEMQKRANLYANQQLMRWLEEVYKAMQGLEDIHVGRILQGLHGLTFGLVDVLTVQQGVLLESDNSFLDQLTRRLHDELGFLRWSQRAFGLYGTYTIQDRVWAGLHLFCWTVDFLEDVLEPPYEEAVQLARQRVQRRLEVEQYAE